MSAVNTMSGKTPASCLLCGAPLVAGGQDLFDPRFGVPGRFSIALCPLCGLEHLNPPPRAADLRALYQRHYNFAARPGGQAASSFYARAREWFLQSPFYQIWLLLDGDIAFHRRRGRGRLLDIGCNEGRSLEMFRRNGFAAEGLEINPDAAQCARARGFTVHAGELADLAGEELFDVIVLSNVLEHTLDPKALLAQTHRRLSPSGQLWISCPNALSWQRDVFGACWINWHPPFHIVHFSLPTLSRLLGESGFLIGQVRDESPALWTAQSLIARFFAREGVPCAPLHNVFLVAILMLGVRVLGFPLLWRGNRRGKGDALVVFAEKA